MAGENPQTGIDTGQKAPEDSNALRGEIQRNLGSLLKSLEQGKAAKITGSSELLESLSILRERNPQISPLFPSDKRTAEVVTADNQIVHQGEIVHAGAEVPSVQVKTVEASTAATVATTRNGAPLTAIEQTIITHAKDSNKKNLELVGSVAEKLIAEAGETGKEDKYYELIEQAWKDPEVAKLQERTNELNGISGEIQNRADILHKLDMLSTEQAQTIREGKDDAGVERLEEEIQSLEERLLSSETDLVGSLENFGDLEEIPEIRELAISLKMQKEQVSHPGVSGQLQAINKFISVFGKALDQGRVRGKELAGIKSFSDRYFTVSGRIDELRRELSSPFSLNPLRETALASRLEKAAIELHSIEAEYRANNTVNDILLLEEVGSGAVASVRRGKVKGGIVGLRGKATDQGEIDVAIKIPIPAEDASFVRQNFYKTRIEWTKQEGELLAQLSTKQQELFPGTLSHFPDSILQQLPDSTPALVMEFIPRENGLSRLKLTDEQFRDIAIKHYETLATAHALGITINDKKGGDLCYFPDTGRYVVFDWNVTHDIQEEKHREKADLSEGVKFLLEAKTGIAYEALDTHPEVLNTSYLKKMKLLRDRLWDKTDTTTAVDMIGILKNIDRLSEEEIMHPKH